MNPNLNYSRWAPASSRTDSPAPHQTASFHNILNGAPSPSLHPSPKCTASISPQLVPSPPRQKRHVDRRAAIDRYSRLFRRLRHRSHFLVYSHHQALASATTVSVGGLHWSMEPGEAETMFRVDFFEWYVLLERCLVEALAAVEVSVSAGYDPLTSKLVETERGGVAGMSNGDGIIGDSKVFREGYSHRFHANVLSALDQREKNPLFEILGQGRVREYLGIAKEFRNRWKDVESASGSEENEEELQRRLRRYEKVMRDLKLEELLGTILQALEGARQMVEHEVTVLGEQLRRAGWDMDDLQTERATEESPWEASADAMELG